MPHATRKRRRARGIFRAVYRGFSGAAQVIAAAFPAGHLLVRPPRADVGCAARGDSLIDKQRPLVLIADDHGDTRETYAGYLTDAGYNVVECGDVTGCVDLARRFRPDVVVLELRAGGAGIEIVKALRGDAALAAIPVLAVTSSPSHEWAGVGFARTLARPCRPDELAAAIAQIVPSRWRRSLP